jgi:hypothetical protein
MKVVARQACFPWGSMIHSIPTADRVAAPWALTSRWLDRLYQAATSVVRVVPRLRCLQNGTPELRMSQEWLEEHERQSRKHPDAI